VFFHKRLDDVLQGDAMQGIARVLWLVSHIFIPHGICLL
jgi:hypothetical protein